MAKKSWAEVQAEFEQLKAKAKELGLPIIVASQKPDMYIPEEPMKEDPPFCDACGYHHVGANTNTHSAPKAEPQLVYTYPKCEVCGFHHGPNYVCYIQPQPYAIPEGLIDAIKLQQEMQKVNQAFFEKMAPTGATVESMKKLVASLVAGNYGLNPDTGLKEAIQYHLPIGVKLLDVKMDGDKIDIDIQLPPSPDKISIDFSLTDAPVDKTATLPPYSEADAAISAKHAKEIADEVDKEILDSIQDDVALLKPSLGIDWDSAAAKETASLGADFIKDQLKKEGFSSKLAKQIAQEKYAHEDPGLGIGNLKAVSKLELFGEPKAELEYVHKADFGDLEKKVAAAMEKADLGKIYTIDSLGAGLPIGKLTTLYGPPSHGKSNLLMQKVVQLAAAEGKLKGLSATGIEISEADVTKKFVAGKAGPFEATFKIPKLDIDQSMELIQKWKEQQLLGVFQLEKKDLVATSQVHDCITYEYKTGKEEPVGQIPMLCPTCGQHYGSCPHTAKADLGIEAKAYKLALKKLKFAKAYSASDELLAKLTAEVKVAQAKLSSFGEMAAEYQASQDYEQLSQTTILPSDLGKIFDLLTSQEFPSEKSNSSEPEEKVHVLFASTATADGYLHIFASKAEEHGVIDSFSVQMDKLQNLWEPLNHLMPLFYEHFKQIWKHYGHPHMTSSGKMKTALDNLHIGVQLAQDPNADAFSFHGKLVTNPSAKQPYPVRWLPEELKKYMKPSFAADPNEKVNFNPPGGAKAKFIKGPKYEVAFHKVEPEKFVKTEAELANKNPCAEVGEKLWGTVTGHLGSSGPNFQELPKPGGKISKLSGPKEKELIAAQNNLKMIEEEIAKRKALVPHHGSDVVLEGLQKAKNGWESKIKVLVIEAEKEKIAQVQQLKQTWNAKIQGPVSEPGFFKPASGQAVFGPEEEFGPLTAMAKPPELLAGEAKPADPFPKQVKAFLGESFVGLPLTPEMAQKIQGQVKNDESFNLNTLFNIGLEAFSMLKFKKEPEVIATWLTGKVPDCCPYATWDDCTSASAVQFYLDRVRKLHFEEKHGDAAKGFLTLQNAAKALVKAYEQAQLPHLGLHWSASWFNAQLPSHAPMLTPEVLMSKALVLSYADGLAEALNNKEFWEKDLPGPELFELTLSNLTQEEIDKVMKTLQKSKSKQSILVHKSSRKELGSKSKAVVVWPFESSSMQVNGEPILYKTQLNEDGSLSCNCAGWCMGSAKSAGGRFCKHTKTIQVEAEMLYKKWKKGEPLGENFEIAPASIQEATSKTLHKALKLKPAEGEATIFKATRIVEI